MSDQPESKPQPECPGPILCSAFGTEHVHAWRDTPETAAELERLRQERAQMGLRIFVAEKELDKIALNHAEPARSGVVAAIGALNGDFPNGAKGTELEMDRFRETVAELETRAAIDTLNQNMIAAALWPDGDGTLQYQVADVPAAIVRLRETNRILLDACKAARLHLQPDFEEPGRTVFWKLVDVINRAEGKA